MKRIIGLCMAVMVLGITPLLAQDAPVFPPLADQVGFIDPALTELEVKGQNVLGESVEFSAYSHSYRLLAVWSVLPGYPEELSSVAGGSALLYQTDTPSPTLLWKQDYAALLGQAPYLTDQRSIGFSAAAPGDWTGDGRVEFAVLGSHSGTAWSSTFYYFYNLEADGRVVSALQGVIPPGFIIGSLETQFDGSLLLAAADIRGEMAMGLPNCCGPFTNRFYEWRGGTIAEASALHPEKYVPSIGSIVYYLTTETAEDPADYAARLLEVLMMYEALGQKDAGWKLVNSIITTAKSDGRLAEGTYVDSTFLPAMMQLYQSGLPFVPPDYAGTNAPGYTDFYAEIPMVQ